MVKKMDYQYFQKLQYSRNFAWEKYTTCRAPDINNTKDSALLQNYYLKHRAWFQERDLLWNYYVEARNKLEEFVKLTEERWDS